MLSEPIFQKDSKGKVRSWQYEVEGPQWRTISGLVDGEKITSGWTTCTPKSKDTAEEQALFEAQADEKKKLKRKYFRTVEEIDQIRGAGVRPMLAETFDGWHKWGGSCFSQPKLDGIRCLANRYGLWSRTAEPIISCPHIVEALIPFFARFPDAVLDGELYNHALRDDFNELSSIIKRTKPKPEDIEKSARIVQYHVYDLAEVTDEWGFKHRSDFIADFLPRHPMLVDVETRIHLDTASADVAYDEYLAAGYEGQMVRLNKPYEQKRSKGLLKRKEWIDAEFPFLRLEYGNGNWAGIPKVAVIQLPNGEECGATIKASMAYCRSIDGKTFNDVTVRFFGYTPDGSLRFPRAITLHEGDRW